MAANLKAGWRPIAPTGSLHASQGAADAALAVPAGRCSDGDK